MIEEERYCIDIVQQVNALSSAANEVALLILQNHIEGCVTDAIREQRGEDYIKELMDTIRKAMKR
jgi:DNA-binding FrmR family transcriptional regulator